MSEAHDGEPEGVSEDTTAADLVVETTSAPVEAGDDAAAAAGEGEAPQPKPKQTAQERINELTAARREAERDRDFYQEQALRAPKPDANAHEAQQQPQADERPTRDQYEDDFEYIEALTDWKAEQAAERRFQQQTQREQATSARTNFETRAKTLYPDGEPAGLEKFKRLPQLPVAVIEIVGDSDIGPKIAEHLGDNPAELARLERLSPIQQARELTRLEQRLSPPVKASPKTATDAPEPAPQARGAGGQFKVDAATTDFAAFEKLADAKG